MTNWAMVAALALIQPPMEASRGCAVRWPGRWFTADAEALGFDGDAFRAAVDSIKRSRGVLAVLIVRNGYIAEEHYARGTGKDTFFNLKSASKSLMSSIVGIGIGEGLFSLDQHISKFLADSTALGDTRKREIRVRHLLEMTSGLASTSGAAYGQWTSASDWIAAVIRRPLIHPPGERFVYSSGNSHLLSEVVSRASGMSLLDYARTRVFEKLGITSVSWTKDPQGRYIGGNDLAMRARDFARFGQLYLDCGRSDGGQVVPADWVRLSTATRIPDAHELYGGYGLSWWTGALGEDSFAAVGYGGQYLFAHPSLDLVVVVFSQLYSKGLAWEKELLKKVRELLVASLKDLSLPVVRRTTMEIQIYRSSDERSFRSQDIPAGTAITVIRNKNGWLLVRLGSREGWLRTETLDDAS